MLPPLTFWKAKFSTAFSVTNQTSGIGVVVRNTARTQFYNHVGLMIHGELLAAKLTLVLVEELGGTKRILDGVRPDYFVWRVLIEDIRSMKSIFTSVIF